MKLNIQTNYNSRLGRVLGSLMSILRISLCREINCGSEGSVSIFTCCMWQSFLIEQLEMFIHLGIKDCAQGQRRQLKSKQMIEVENDHLRCLLPLLAPMCICWTFNTSRKSFRSKISLSMCLKALYSVPWAQKTRYVFSCPGSPCLGTSRLEVAKPRAWPNVPNVSRSLVSKGISKLLAFWYGASGIVLECLSSKEFCCCLCSPPCTFAGDELKIDRNGYCWFRSIWTNFIDILSVAISVRLRRRQDSPSSVQSISLLQLLEQSLSFPNVIVSVRRTRRYRSVDDMSYGLLASHGTSFSTLWRTWCELDGRSWSRDLSPLPFQLKHQRLGCWWHTSLEEYYGSQDSGYGCDEWCLAAAWRALYERNKMLYIE